MKQLHFAPYKTLFAVLFLLFILEVLVMALINYLEFPAHVEAILDAAALIFLAMPVLYFLFLRPMLHQYQETERARKTIETIHATSRELSRDLDLDRVLDVFMRQTKALIPMHDATLDLLEAPESRVSRSVRRYHWNADGEHSLVPGVELREHQIIDEILKDQNSRILPDMLEVAGFHSKNDLSYQRSWMGVPLVSNGKVVGLCEFTHSQPGVFTQEHLQLAEGLVSQGVIAIQNASLYDQVRLAHEKLQILTHKIVMFQEHERRYLAKSLNFSVDQSVVAVKNQLKALEADPSLSEAVCEQIATLENSLEQVSKNLQVLANDLRPASLDFQGLQSALKHHIEHLQDKHPCALNIHFLADNLQVQLPEVVEITLFRIAQEALLNVMQHAQACSVNIQLQQRDEDVVLIIEDDGVGFSFEAVDLDKCFGLLDMRERAEMIGGELNIESSPGSGTTICFCIPLARLQS